MNFKLVFVLILLVSSTCVLAQERPNYEAPSLIGHSQRMMKTAGFWISRHPTPDAVIMSPDAVDQFNARLRSDNKLIKDIFTLVQDLKTESLLENLQNTLSDILAKDYYTSAGARVDVDFMDNVKRNMK